ncbi:hypothetical protein AK812_SmicGene31001 [Symbiodinium microadriaticum]|uniref:Sodium/calcium exchanger membrane region domain-containing protein n=1 Tax=Symbiodinium microadriaticum TaxID=2951 RepID=A0A1Q9CXU9_SYMMI|nr:hypothetical protein AK812_SmicGene31001 [Symbiodinium microadriaticum]
MELEDGGVGAVGIALGRLGDLNLKVLPSPTSTMAVLADGSLLQPPELKTVLVRHFPAKLYSGAVLASSDYVFLCYPKAQSQAAATALFAGPLFNLLVGAGVSMLLVTMQRGGPVIIADESYPSLMMQVGCIAVAASALVLAFAFEKQGGAIWPVAMWSIYLVFIIGVVMAEVDLRLAGHA